MTPLQEVALVFGASCHQPPFVLVGQTASFLCRGTSISLARAWVYTLDRACLLVFMCFRCPLTPVCDSVTEAVGVLCPRHGEVAPLLLCEGPQCAASATRTTDGVALATDGRTPSDSSSALATC